MVNSHQKFYGGGGGGNDGPASSNELGAGAAMQALKAFTSGGSGGSQNQLIGLAMAEAEKLFDQQSANGNAVSSIFFFFFFLFSMALDEQVY